MVIQTNGQRTSQPFPIMPECPTGIEVIALNKCIHKISIYLLNTAQLYVSNIPFDMYEDELLPLFASVGDICMFRLMMSFSGANRGFAYLMYVDRTASERALQLFDRCTVGPPGPRHRMFVQISANRCRLLLGNMHNNLHADAIYTMVQQLTQGQGVQSVGGICC